MPEYLLATTDDYRAQATRLYAYSENCPSPADRGMMQTAGGSILALADRVDYLENVLERLDEWIADFAYYSDGSKA